MFNEKRKSPDEVFRSHAARHRELVERTEEHCASALAAAAALLEETFRRGGKLLICGNGGSAADCQHLATEFMCRLRSSCQRIPFPAVALTTDTSFLTAFPNDYCFEDIFARQVEALCDPGDVLLAISTSGKSPNVLRGAEAARHKGGRVVALCGAGGPLAEQAHVVLAVPATETMLVQEMHLMLEHALCVAVEDRFLRNPWTISGACRGKSPAEGEGSR